jgi:PQQ-dependent catabolism-associated CXXCW motif protein
MFNKKLPIRQLIGLILCLMCAQLHAMTLETKDNILYATGHVGDDYVAFEAAFKNPAIDTLVLVDSPGGDMWNGMHIGRMIAAKGIKTVAAGYCISACSMLFIAGKERQFSNSHPPARTYLGIHGPHNKYTKVVSPEFATEIYAFFKQQIGGRFNHTVINQALYNMSDSSGLLRVFDVGRSPVRPPVQCPSSQAPSADCTQYKALDAYQLGIVTSSQLETLELPTAMAPVLSLYGKPLSQAFDNYPAFLALTAKARCDTFSCEHDLPRLHAAEPFNALALAMEGDGIGYADQQSSAERAFIRALSTCNFPSVSRAKLCEVQTVNGMDVRPLYAAAAEQNVKGIKELTVPPLVYYADEEYGGTFTKADGLRTEKWRDITPKSLDGISGMGTQALAKWLQAAKAPILVDAAGYLGETLPTALVLANGGFAFENRERERQCQWRFEQLMDVLAPKRDEPVVFFCMGRESWFSVNAALRAKAMGYTQVFWYRGGMEAWKKANLPVVQSLPRAALT